MAEGARPRGVARRVAGSSRCVLEQQRAMVYALAHGVSVVSDDAPVTYSEAMSGAESREWDAACRKEIASCEQQGTWTVVRRADLPAGTNVLPVKWVFKKKTDENGALTQHKARITPKGFRQMHGVEYFEVFAHTGKYKSMRVVLSLAARYDLEICQQIGRAHV